MVATIIVVVDGDGDAVIVIQLGTFVLLHSFIWLLVGATSKDKPTEYLTVDNPKIMFCFYADSLCGSLLHRLATFV